MHQYAKQQNYDLAACKVQSGNWSIDLENGLVIGAKGQPFVRTNSWGYIQIKFRHPEDWRKEVAVVAHRVIWEHLHGPLPEHLVINHINGDKKDNTPTNLELVTPSANAKHAFATGLNKPRLGTDCHNTVLMDDDVRDIYARACRGNEGQASIAADYNISREVVSNIKRGWSWTHVTGAHKRARPVLV